MKNEKFKVIQFIRDFIIKVDKEMENFPRKDIEIKNRIRSNSYDLLEISYEANNTLNKEYKIELLGKMIAKIKVIDFLLNISYEKEIISNKKYIKLGEKMDDIIRYTSGWLNTLLHSN